MGNIKHKLSIVVPAYNEEFIIEKNTKVLVDYLKTIEHKYNWEVILVNDGSKDNTGIYADKLVAEIPGVIVVHHFVNKNLGHALRTGFHKASGDGIIVLDLDLSYSADHIEKLADTLFNEMADVVIASPYMPGGKCTAVPRKRLFLSKVVNRIMRVAAQEKFYTYTGMVRAYRSDFIKNVDLKTKDYEINPEILYKSMILRARILEIPAHLDWSEQNKETRRTSSIRILKGIFSGLMSGFIFRPYIFFMGIGFISMMISLYIIAWIFINTFRIMPSMVIDVKFIDDKFSYAVGEVFQHKPHAFLIGGFMFVVSILFLGFGFLSLQIKRYFEELFHLGTSNKVKS
jgi:glycosyltransferase involved in cell wall biosynthesis